MMKANNQLGFININEDSIDKIIKDDEVIFERGFLREKTSTTLPINFGGVGKDLKDYRVYGNTVQNGTPTPGAPIDMVSCGDRTKNLCGELEQGGYDVNTGEKIVNASQYRNSNFIKVSPNANYIFSINSLGQAINVLEYKLDGTYIGRIGTTAIQANNYFTTSNETAYINIFRGTSAGIEKWQIEQNDTITSYEPYGYKIPINIKSKNIVNNTLQSQTKNGITLTRNIDGSITVNGTATSNAFFDVGIFTQKQGVAYTLSGCPQGGGNNKYRLYLMGEQTPYFDDGEGKDFPIVNTDTQRTLRLAIYNNMTVENLTFYPMIKLTEISDCRYQPYYNETTNIYLDEPLRKIDEYSDYIDFVNQKVVKNIKEYIFNGSENWTLYNNKVYFATNVLNDIGQQQLLCNYFAFGTTTYNNNINYNTSNQHLNIYPSQEFLNTYSKATDFKNWMLTHNLIILGILSTPTEEDIELPNIPTVDGNNTLNIETEITPSQVYIKYKSNE